MELNHIFIVAIRGSASDILVKVGQVPKYRRGGDIVGLQGASPITREQMDQWVAEMLPDFLKPIYQETGDVDFAFENQIGTRFRVNVFRQKGVQGFVARVVDSYVRTIEELQLPLAVSKIAEFKRGIVFVTGTVGSGKSTTLAAIVEQINETYPYHIITVEDPIEYVYEDRNSIINQREVGRDTRSFQTAVKSALRQNPDVLVVGELRDRETMRTALMAAETGILVMSTLHTMDVVQTMTRILSFFPPDDHSVIIAQLSRTLRMCVCQRLLPTRDGKSRVVSAEVMVVNSRIREIISKGNQFHEIMEVIKTSQDYYGMQTFDQSLLDLYQKKIISQKVAMANASSRSDLASAIRGMSS